MSDPTATSGFGAGIAAEYFIGSDPGAGNGTTITVSDHAALSAGIGANAVSITHLSPGTHKLGLRVRDGQGRWSAAVYRRFTIEPGDFELAGGLDRDGPADQGMSDPTSTTGFGAGVAAEYFIGNDPGAGNGTTITVSDHAALSAGIATQAVPITHLAPGTHELGLRVLDSQGRWSAAVYRRFQIQEADLIRETETAVAASQQITGEPAAQAVWSLRLPGACLDPAMHQVIVAGRVIELQPRPGESARAFVYRLKESILADPVLAGWIDVELMNRSTLAITAKQPGFLPSDWVVASSQFSLSQTVIGNLGSEGRRMVAAEWFLNVDPGEGGGSAVPIVVEAGGHGVGIDPVVVDVSMMRAGAHRVGLRIRNAAGRWSAPVYRGLRSFALFGPPDTTAPVITLTGGELIEVPFGESFVDPGVTAIDETDGDLSGSVSVSGHLDPGIPGDQSLVYTVADLAGNIARVVRTVRVADANPPVISGTADWVLHQPPASLDVFAGLSATDIESGALSHRIRLVSGQIDWFAPGRYDLIFEVSDSSGQVGTFSRSITLSDTAFFHPDYDSWMAGQPAPPGTSQSVMLPDQNADGDGFTNRDEWLTDTNPFDESSHLMLHMTRSADGLRFHWCGRQRIRYWLESATGLSGWQPLTGKMDGGAFSGFEWDHPLDGGSPPVRFFRLGSEPRQPIFVPVSRPRRNVRIDRLR